MFTLVMTFPLLSVDSFGHLIKMEIALKMAGILGLGIQVMEISLGKFQNLHCGVHICPIKDYVIQVTHALIKVQEGITIAQIFQWAQFGSSMSIRHSVNVKPKDITKLNLVMEKEKLKRMEESCLRDRDQTWSLSVKTNIQAVMLLTATILTKEMSVCVNVMQKHPDLKLLPSILRANASASVIVVNQ